MQFQLNFSDTDPEHLDKRLKSLDWVADTSAREIAEARVAIHWGQGFRFFEGPYPSCHCIIWQTWPAGVDVAISDDISEVTCQLCLRDHRRFNDPTEVLGGLAIPRHIGSKNDCVICATQQL